MIDVNNKIDKQLYTINASVGYRFNPTGLGKIKYKSELVELNQTQVKTHTLFFGLGLGKLCGPSPILLSLETRVELKENQRNTSRR